MTDVDTAALKISGITGDCAVDQRNLDSLCDALDAARAEADRRMSPPEMYWRKKCGEAASLYVKEMEAKFREQARAEAAEARIAAALTICDRRDRPGPVCVDYDDETEEFRRALIGGIE